MCRKLKPDARPIQNADDPAGICSAADCRLTVYPTIDLAKQLWVKGSFFTVPALLNVSPDSEQAKQFDGASVAIFRYGMQSSYDHGLTFCEIDWHQQIIIDSTLQSMPPLETSSIFPEHIILSIHKL